MRKKIIFAKFAALVMACVVGVTASGCSAKKQTEFVQTDSTSEEQTNIQHQDTAGSNGIGRYIETTVFEGGGFADLVQTQTLNDGQILFLNNLTKQKVMSKDGGNTWDTEINDTYAAFVDEHYSAAATVAKDGTIAIVGMDKKAGLPDGMDAEYEYNLYIYNTDNSSKQISIEMPNADSHPRALAFDEQGMLYVYVSGCKNIYQVDVAAGTSEKLLTLEESCDLMQVQDNMLMCMTFEKIFLYDLSKKSFVEDEILDSFIEKNYKDMAWTGAGYTAYTFLGADNTVYVAEDKGLYRHVIGGSAVEQVIDGSLSSLGDPSNSIMAMIVNDKNEFLTAYSNGKIVKFVYDETVPSVPNDKIVVYSLNEDDLVKQTISAYQIQYPDMYIEYQIGMDEGSITREDALKKLNTQLLSGSGPDVIILDGINIDTYAEKGVLMDLSDIVDAVDRQDGLYRNLIDQLAINDTIYAVPAKFYIPVIYGDKDFVNHISDYQSMADMVEKARERYSDTNLLSICSATGIMKMCMPVCAPAWKDESGQLNQGRIREFLEQSKRIYDVQMNGTPQEDIIIYGQSRYDTDGTDFEDSKYFMMVHDTYYKMQEAPFAYGEIVDAHTYRSTLSMPRTPGFENMVIKLLSGQNSSVYHPASLAGINTATKDANAAKQFVNIMLSATVQQTMQFGFPINKSALPLQFAYDESDLGEDGGQYYESFSMNDGRKFEFVIYPVNQDGIDQLEGWIASLDTPYLSDTVLESAVYTEGAKYLEGAQDIDTAVKAISDRVEIYLYE